MSVITEINFIANRILRARLELARQLHYLHFGFRDRYNPLRVDELRAQIRRDEQRLRELWPVWRSEKTRAL